MLLFSTYSSWYGSIPMHQNSSLGQATAHVALLVSAMCHETERGALSQVPLAELDHILGVQAKGSLAEPRAPVESRLAVQSFLVFWGCR